jgi:tyrosinase
VDKLEEATMPLVEEYLNKKIATGRNNKCTLENAVVRREWLAHTQNHPLISI